MHKVEFQSCGRSMRWYEWLVALLLLVMFAGARAASVYKCTDAEGHVAYQHWGCAAQQQAGIIEILPAPAYAPSPHYTVAAHAGDENVRKQPSARRVTTQETAYECHASDGRTFYRLSACPHSIGADASGQNASHGKRGAKHGSGTTPVSSRRIAHEEACRQIHRAGAIGRNGHEFDEAVSTYEHDLGHDPCR